LSSETVLLEHAIEDLNTIFLSLYRDRSFAIGHQNDSHSFMLILFELIEQEAGIYINPY